MIGLDISRVATPGPFEFDLLDFEPAASESVNRGDTRAMLFAAVARQQLGTDRLESRARDSDEELADLRLESELLDVLAADVGRGMA